MWRQMMCDIAKTKARAAHVKGIPLRQVSHPAAPDDAEPHCCQLSD